MGGIGLGDLGVQVNRGIVVCDGEGVVKGELGVEGVVYAPLVGNVSKPSVLAAEVGLSSPLAAMLVPSYVKLSILSNVYDSGATFTTQAGVWHFGPMAFIFPLQVEGEVLDAAHGAKEVERLIWTSWSQ